MASAGIIFFTFGTADTRVVLTLPGRQPMAA
jgi:hypothetical protein